MTILFIILTAVFVAAMLAIIFLLVFKVKHDEHKRYWHVEERSDNDAIDWDV